MSLWLYTDGGARGNPGPAAAAYILKNGQGRVVSQRAECIGVSTNNEAEYRALILGLRAAQDHGSGHLHWASDSLLVVNQMRGTNKVREPRLQVLHADAQNAIGQFKLLPEHRPRADPEIAAADRLYNKALDECLKVVER
jgi:ribonuclease HI